MAACCRWAAPTSGATSSTASTSATAWATPQLYALTTPLLTTSSGAKMGKSATGAVWLNGDLLQPLRFLAVLAQHRGRRCRPLPEDLHAPAARRDRAAGGARRRRDQRGQEGPGHRSHRDRAWPRGRRAGGRDGAQDLRGRRARRHLPTIDDCRGRARRRHRRAGAVRHAPGSPPRTARRAAMSRAARCASTMQPVTDERRMVGTGDLTARRRHQALARQEEARSGAAERRAL